MRGYIIVFLEKLHQPIVVKWWKKTLLLTLLFHNMNFAWFDRYAKMIVLRIRWFSRRSGGNCFQILLTLNGMTQKFSDYINQCLCPRCTKEHGKKFLFITAEKRLYWIIGITVLIVTFKCNTCNYILGNKFPRHDFSSLLYQILSLNSISVPASSW